MRVEVELHKVVHDAFRRFGHLEGFVGEVGPHVQPVTGLSGTRLVGEKVVDHCH